MSGSGGGGSGGRWGRQPRLDRFSNRLSQSRRAVEAHAGFPEGQGAQFGGTPERFAELTQQLPRSRHRAVCRARLIE